MSEYFHNKQPRELKDRIVFPLVFVLVVFSVLVIRLWFLQIMHVSQYRELSLNNRVRLTKSPAPRGLIFDRNGVRLAENRPGFDLSIIPEDVEDMDRTITLLAGRLNIEGNTLKKRLKKSRKRPPYRPVKLKEDLKWEEMVAVSEYNFELPGVRIEVGPKRTYPYGMATAHLLGYVGEISEQKLKKLKEKGDYTYTPGDVVGKYGLEHSFEDNLTGKNGGRQIEVDARGNLINVIKEIPPDPGRDVHLTIDMPTQLAAWEAMDGKAGAVVAMDPSNGKILAMVSAPSFDPNALIGLVSRDAWNEIISHPKHVLNNRVIQGQYPPASTFKIVTAAAALDRGAITPTQKIYSGPSFKFGRRSYRDWKAAGHGKINVYSAIVESSDTFFYQAGLKTGVAGIAEFSRKFGLGERTGIDLANEKKGLVPTDAWKRKAIGERWYEGETISVAVGQGFMLVTPLQLLNTFAGVANDGTLFVPQMVERIQDPDGKITDEFKPKVLKKIDIKPETLVLIKKALRGVVTEEKGTARWLKRTKLGIAGKTGTAQVVSSKERVKDIRKTKYKFRDHAWFAGFAPYDDPKIAVVVLVEHGGFGSVAAAPVARKVIAAYLESLEKDNELKKPKKEESKKTGKEKPKLKNVKKKTPKKITDKKAAVAKSDIKTTFKKVDIKKVATEPEDKSSDKTSALKPTGETEEKQPDKTINVSPDITPDVNPNVTPEKTTNDSGVKAQEKKGVEKIATPPAINKTDETEKAINRVSGTVQ